MEEFSVLRTPAYPKYHGALSQPHYTGRGHALTYYEPIYDVDLKIPGLGIAEMPFVPIQHIRSDRNRRPFVPRHLTEEDMIQINLKAQRKAKDILKDFHPAQKASYESPRDFMMKKDIESRMDEIRESCAATHNYFQKAEKYDFTRKSLYNPRLATRFTEKDTLKDSILDAKMEHIDDMKVKLGQDDFNHRAKSRILSSACRESPMVEIEKLARKTSYDGKEDSVVPELQNIEAAPPAQSKRRSSRDTRADQLKELQERIDKQETEADCFERTFGRHLSKLRGEVNNLTNMTDNYVEDTRYRSFKVDQFLKRHL